MKDLFIVDRIEGKWAVIEYPAENITFNVPISLFIEKVKEGDMIDFEVHIYSEAAAREKKKIEQMIVKHMEDI